MEGGSLGNIRPEGSARLVLLDGVTLLHPEDLVFEAMLEGWTRQQRGGRFILAKTIADRVSVVRRFSEAVNEYPWQWTATQVDEWMSDLVAQRGREASTMRHYQGALRMFCDYITSPHYGWVAECENRFGTHPVQVCHEWNTTAHLVDYEGRPDRRPMTREEIQRMFDYADDQVEQALRRRRKGALTAYRDATALKVLYGWGLRCNEACQLDTTDFYRSAKAPELGRYALVHVRYGKRSRGSVPKRRTVHTVMPWAAEALADYVENILPRYRHHQLPAVFPTERGGRLRPREIEDRFAEYRDALGMDQALTPHCLRHSFVTHLIEDGADPKFVQELVGHRFASTTAVYTGVGGDFMNAMMRKVLDRALATDDEEDQS